MRDKSNKSTGTKYKINRKKCLFFMSLPQESSLFSYTRSGHFSMCMCVCTISPKTNQRKYLNCTKLLTARMHHVCKNSQIKIALFVSFEISYSAKEGRSLCGNKTSSRQPVHTYRFPSSRNWNRCTIINFINGFHQICCTSNTPDA